MKFFGGGESIRSEAADGKSGTAQPVAPADNPGGGGGYVKDGAGLGGGYVKDGAGLGGGYMKDGPSLGGGHVKDGPGLGGGYVKDGPGLGGGYVVGQGVGQIAAAGLPIRELSGNNILPPSQVWTISPGRQGAAPALFCVTATLGPGSGVRILDEQASPAFRDSVRAGEQNFYTYAQELVDGRDPRAYEFSVQLRALDADISGDGLGLATLVALGSALLGRSVREGLVVVGSLDPGGLVEKIPSLVAIAELAAARGAVALLLPISSRKQLSDLSDELATGIRIEFYSDLRDACLKCLTR
jgi:hypothetical protein